MNDSSCYYCSAPLNSDDCDSVADDVHVCNDKHCQHLADLEF